MKLPLSTAILLRGISLLHTLDFLSLTGGISRTVESTIINDISIYDVYIIIIIVNNALSSCLLDLKGK